MPATITLTAADGHVLPAYHTTPDGRPRGQLVVLHEFFGLNDHIRSVADRFAALGFGTIVPGLSDRAEAPARWVDADGDGLMDEGELTRSSAFYVRPYPFDIPEIQIRLLQVAADAPAGVGERGTAQQHDQRAAGQRGPRPVAGHPRDQGVDDGPVPEHRRGHLDGEPHGRLRSTRGTRGHRAARAGRVPQVRHREPQHVAGQRAGQPGGLRRRDERRREQQSAHRVLPADDRLVPDDPAVGEVRRP